MSRDQRVLLVRLSAMGDVVESLGAVAALHRARPELELHFVTQRETAPLLAGLPGIASVVALDRRGGLRAFRRTAREARALDCGLAMDLQGNWKSALMARLAMGLLPSPSAGKAVGLAGHNRREPLSGWLLHRRISAQSVGARTLPHPGVVAATVLRHIEPALMPEAPALPAPTEDELRREVAALQGLGLDPAAPLQVLIDTDPADNRSLSAMQREALVARSPGATLWLRGPGERHPPPAGAPALTHGPSEVQRLLALGHIVAGVGGTVVGPDTGATHVLAATGAKTQVVMGAQDPAHTAPWTADVLQHPKPPACMPCRRRRCSHPDGPVCMDFLLVD